MSTSKDPGWMVFCEAIEETQNKIFPVYFKKYEIRERLGSGMTAEVHKAYAISDKTTLNPVAVKFVTKKDKEIQHKTLCNELEAPRKLDHRNVIKLVDYCENSYRRMIVMEFAAGGDLFQRAVDFEMYSEANSANIVKQILEGVEHIHSRGVVHRDLKLQNILAMEVSRNPHIKICDFGLADSTGSATMTLFCGTPRFISPEILLRKEYTKAVDLWSVGVISYMLISGKAPINDQLRLDLFYHIIKGDFNFNSPAWDQISSKAKKFIQTLLCVDVKFRATSLDALANEWILDNQMDAEEANNQQSTSSAISKWKRATNVIRAIKRMKFNIKHCGSELKQRRYRRKTI